MKPKPGDEIVLFVALFKVREGSIPLDIDKFRYRRGQWGHPEGEYSDVVKLVDEYWLQTDDPRYVGIFETEEPHAIMEIVSRWEDHFEVTVVPAVRVEELLPD
jgi:hypothetical protein